MHASARRNPCARLVFVFLSPPIASLHRILLPLPRAGVWSAHSSWEEDISSQAGRGSAPLALMKLFIEVELSPDEIPLATELFRTLRYCLACPPPFGELLVWNGGGCFFGLLEPVGGSWVRRGGNGEESSQEINTVSESEEFCGVGF